MALSKASNLLTILEQNPRRLKRIRFLGKLFENEGFELRIAGGAVRDILCGMEPKDIDFATTARPEKTLDILRPHEDILRIFVTAAGQKHGTVAVKFKEVDFDLKRIKLSKEENYPLRENTHSSETRPKAEYDDESPYEITTLRCDRITDGRHADVMFVSDWQVDAERRDLTMNAMFLTLDEGKLIDFYNGECDLKNGVVRFVGDANKRVKEDFLRILRFFRFWSRYGRSRKPDPDTLNVIRNNLDGLDIISGERIWQEIKKIFAHLPCAEVVSIMLELNVFNQINFTDKTGEEYKSYIHFVENEVEPVQENIRQFLKMHLNDQIDSSKSKKIDELVPTIAVTSALESSESCLEAHKRMKFSNLERETMLYIIDNRRNNAPELQELKRQLTKVPQADVQQLLVRIEAYLIYRGLFSLMKEIDSWKVPSFPLRGDQVAKEVKHRNLDRTLIKVILEDLRNEWADANYTLDATALIEKMHELLDRMQVNK